MKATHSHGKADYIGIIGSLVCIIHCLLVPALAFGSTMLHNHGNFGLLSLDLVFILINGFAVYYATRDHKSLLIRTLLWGGLFIFAVSLLFEGRFEIFSWLSYVGSGLLIGGHLLNLYICQIAPRMRFKSSK